MQGRACLHCADPGRVGCAATAAAPTLPHLTVVLRWLLPCVVSHARLDGPVLPGRKVACCGHKMGLLGTWLRGMLALPPGHNTLTVIVAVCTGVNNGRFWFDHVRIPRVNLLNKYASVTPEGEYTSMIPSDDLRFAVSMGELVAGRVNMTGGANNISKVRTRTPAYTIVASCCQLPRATPRALAASPHDERMVACAVSLTSSRSQRPSATPTCGASSETRDSPSVASSTTRFTRSAHAAAGSLCCLAPCGAE